LKLIRQDSQFPREKLSLLSGIKTALAFLYSPNIIWVPISLEEILRVSGNAGLAMDEGLFSTKNLGGIGSFSDDLLLIGLEECEEELLMHFYPVELKIGGLGIVKKGKEQGQKTADLLKEHLNKEGFLGQFYKNFFAKIALTNAEKMSLFHVWDKQKWSVVFEDYREDLLNNNFKISYNLNKAIGDFGLVYFGKDTIKRTLNTSEGLMKIDLLEIDGYDFLVKSVDDSIDLFHNSTTTIETSKLLINNLPSCSDTQSLVQNNQEVIIDKSDTIVAKVEEIISIENEKIQSNTNNNNNNNNNKGIEVMFGTNLNNSKPVIWEPNNTNKVMHTNTGIIGTMGTGKTQFTKSLITQLHNKTADNIGDEKLGILIFDYKGDYIKEDFVSATNAKVYNLEKLPYNPLKLDVQNAKPKLPLHTANDLKETISTAFNLGNVQKIKLRDIIIEAYQNKGI
jgi:DNA phosphorothioation-dependent restriction protein DptH